MARQFNAAGLPLSRSWAQTRRAADAVDGFGKGRAPGDLHRGPVQRRRRHPRGRHRPPASTDRERDGLPPAARPRAALGRRQERPHGPRLHRQAHAEYRFDIRYRALVGGTRRQVSRGRKRVPTDAARLCDPSGQDLAGYRPGQSESGDPKRAPPPRPRPSRAHRPRDAPGVLPRSSYDLGRRLCQPGTGHDVHLCPSRRRPPPRHAKTTNDYAKALARLLHIDDEERYAAWPSGCPPATPPTPAIPVRARSDSSGCCWRHSASASGLFRAGGRSGSSGALSELRVELADLLDVLRGGSASTPVRSIRPGDLPLHSHATYALYGFAAYGLVGNGALRETREGVLWSASRSLICSS